MIVPALTTIIVQASILLLLSISFILTSNTIGSIKGIFIVSCLISFTIFLLIISLQRKTRFGLTLTTIFDRVELAQIQGINISKVFSNIWFIAGGLAGLAGAMRPFTFQTFPFHGTWIMASIIAASLLGGMTDIRGCFFGAFLVGLVEIGGILYFQAVFGAWIGDFQQIIPILVIALCIYFYPNGLKGRNR